MNDNNYLLSRIKIIFLIQKRHISSKLLNKDYNYHRELQERDRLSEIEYSVLNE